MLVKREHKQSLSSHLADWSSSLTLDDIPDDVVHSTKLRILDTVGLMYAGATLPVGRSVFEAMVEEGSAGSSSVVGFKTKASPEVAAMVNGACATILEFDDTHIETAIHVSSPVVAAALAAGEACGVNGSELIVAVAAATELSCRLGLVAPGEFHRNAFHPTGVIGAFGAAYAAGRLFGLNAQQMANAIGVAGSQASGLTASWVDGTDTKSMHGGWSAHCGIVSSKLASKGITGPDLVFEGPLGLFRSHVQQPVVALDYERARKGLGEDWESRSVAFKSYPTGGFNQGYVDAAFAILREQPLRPEDIAEIICPIPEYIVGLVAEPVEQKLAPASSWQCRVSLPWTLAETIVLGRLDRHAFNLQHPRVDEIRALAQKIRHKIDPTLVDRRAWPGHVIIRMKDGTTHEKFVPHCLGSRENPHSDRDIVDKFMFNVSDQLGAESARRLSTAILGLDLGASVRGVLQ